MLCMILNPRIFKNNSKAKCHYPRAQASTKKLVIERTRDLIYLEFVATDFFLNIISPCAGENSGDLA